MSIWASTLSFDGEGTSSGEYRQPFRYAENREPDEDGRGGHLMLAETYRDAGHLAPFLRLSVEGRYSHAADDGGVGNDVTLDEAHVKELHRYLGEWIGRLR